MTGRGIDISRLEALVDERLGKPFRPGTRGPEAYYCLGLYLDLLEACAGVVIPDPFSPQPAEEAMRDFWRRFLRLASLGDLQPLDALFWRSGDGPHVATVENDRWVVSVSRAGGVHRMRLADAVSRAEAAYRPKELVVC